MKSIVAIFKNMQAFSFLVGLAWGAALGLILFCYLVPHGPKAIAMLRSYTYRMLQQEKVIQKNKDEFRALYASPSSQMPMSGMNHGAHPSNPYMMSEVTSESQFLNDMVLHHEAAVIMAEQVLKLPSIRTEVRNLANSIIKAQTIEMAQMKAWSNISK